MTDTLSADTIDFVRSLEKHGVRYLMIGGHAVVFHGYARLTVDVDFAYAPDPANAARLYAALLEFWGGSVPVVTDATELTNVGMVFQFGRPPNRIDLLSRADGLDFDAAWQRRISHRVGDPTTALQIADLDNLRSMKRAAGRPKDLDDLENLPERRGS